MNNHGKINYIEFPSTDLALTKHFFHAAFGWEFEDYGPEYVAIHKAGLDGGFFKSGQVVSTETGSCLVVIYSDAPEETLTKIKSVGGKIIRPMFSFPGGRRFHFRDPTGNEYAVWGNVEIS